MVLINNRSSILGRSHGLSFALARVSLEGGGGTYCRRFPRAGSCSIGSLYKDVRVHRGLGDGNKRKLVYGHTR